MSVAPEWSVVPAPPGRLYESARWIPEAGAFQWVDILGSSLHRWRPGAEQAQSRALDLEFATMALPLDAERSLVTSRSSLHEYHWGDDTLRTLGSWDFAPDVRFNDGGIAPDGSVLLGTMSMERRPTGGSLFRWEGDDLVPVVRDVGISNGIGWAALDRGYYIDSLVPRVHHLDISATNPLRTFVDLDASDEPDGLAVTPEGEVLVALWEGSRLARLASDGSRLPDVPVPAHSPTSVAIGGADLDLVLVTTADVDGAGVDPTYDGRVLVTSRSELP